NVIANTWIAFQLEQTVGLLPPDEASRVRDRVDGYLDRALEIAPDDPYALALRAIFAFAHDDPDTAAETYEHFLEIDPPDDARLIIDEYGLADQLDALEDADR